MSNYINPEVTPVQNSTYAIISLISGILAWLGLFGLGGIVAIIFGHMAKNEIRNSAGRIGGDGMASAGLILGYANVAITLIGICLFILVLFGAISTPFLCLPFLNGINVDLSAVP